MYLNLETKLPYIYVDMGRLCIKGSSLHFINDISDVIIPYGRLAVIFLGPGSTITHSAIKKVTQINCSLIWVGQDISKCYAISSCQARSSKNLLKQIYLHTSKKSVLLKRYTKLRFGKEIRGNLSEEKIRGFEGAKMKKAYIENALKYGIPYGGRMKNDEWDKQTIYNKSISIVNSFLYGMCCAVINALGYSTALGLLHKGNTLSFVFDIADLYKIDFSIPLGFETAQEFSKKSDTFKFEKVLRKKAMDKFFKEKILTKIMDDVEGLLDDSMYSKKYQF